MIAAHRLSFSFLSVLTHYHTGRILHEVTIRSIESSPSLSPLREGRQPGGHDPRFKFAAIAEHSIGRTIVDVGTGDFGATMSPTAGGVRGRGAVRDTSTSGACWAIRPMCD
jgi:hypothetical protein